MLQWIMTVTFKLSNEVNYWEVIKVSWLVTRLSDFVSMVTSRKQPPAFGQESFKRKTGNLSCHLYLVATYLLNINIFAIQNINVIAKLTSTG